MRRSLLPVFMVLQCLLCGPSLTRGQSPDQLSCDKEGDPLKSYCNDINQFLVDADHTRGADGRINRADPSVHADLMGLLRAYSIPDRFSSLLAPTIAIQAAKDALPLVPDNSSATVAALSGVNQNRPDKQTSPPSQASGTTSLVEKAGAPPILGFALESGAIVQTVSGNTGTLTGNADGIIRALTGQQVLCFDCGDRLGTAVLKNINLSASFLLDQQSSSSLSTSGAANSFTPSGITSLTLPKTVGKLSSFSARYEVWNPYDPHSSKFLSAWDASVRSSKEKIDNLSQDFQKKLVSLLNQNKLDNDKQFQNMLTTYYQTFCDDADARDLNKLKQDFLTLYNATVDAWMRDDPDFAQKVGDLNLSLSQYRALWEQLLKTARGQPLLTFQYDFSRPASRPETHDFRLVYGYTPKGGAGLLSVNAGISIYGSTIPAGAKYGRLHDGQISAEYDRPVTIKGNSNQATFSLAAYWQYQPDPSVLNITSGNLAPGTNIQLPGNAQVLLGTAGSLWVTQAKVTINGKSGIKIPISVTWSNKTDLLTGSKFRPQIGVSYDLSSLNGLFGGSASQ